MRLTGYDIIRVIHRDVSGVLYLAHHQASNRQRVIKVLPKTRLSDEHSALLFIEEGEYLCQLDHHQLAHIHEVGECDEGFYLVSDRIAGESLSARRQSLCLLDKIYTVKQMLSVLDVMDTQGFGHYNLKPSNIFLAEADTRAILTDYWIAYAAQFTPHERSSQKALESAYYASPESIADGELDIRSDIYSIGALFFDLLANRVPYEAPSIGRVERKQTTLPPPKLPKNRAMFQDIINRAMAKAPDARYQNGQQMLDALSEINDEEIILLDTKPGDTASKVKIFSPRPKELPKPPPPAKERKKRRSKIPRIKIVFSRPEEETEQTMQEPLEVSAQPGQLAEWPADMKTAESVETTGENEATAQNAYKDSTVPAAPVHVPDQTNPTAGKAPSYRLRKTLVLILLASVGLYGWQHRNELVKPQVSLTDSQQPASPVIESKPKTAPETDASSSRINTALEAEVISASEDNASLPAAPETEKNQPSPELSAQLIQAAEYLSQLKLTTPSEENAHDLYRSVLKEDPSNKEALAGIETILLYYRTQAVRLQRNKAFDPAIRLVKKGLGVSPDNPGLSALLEELEAQKQQTEQQQAVMQQLVQAQLLVESGQVMSPEDNNAVIAYRQVLKLVPDNLSAKIALEEIRERALREVVEHLDSSRLDEADLTLSRINSLFPKQPPVAELEERLALLREQQETLLSPSVITRNEETGNPLRSELSAN